MASQPSTAQSQRWISKQREDISRQEHGYFIEYVKHLVHRQRNGACDHKAAWATNHEYYLYLGPLSYFYGSQVHTQAVRNFAIHQSRLVKEWVKLYTEVALRGGYRINSWQYGVSTVWMGSVTKHTFKTVSYGNWTLGLLPGHRIDLISGLFVELQPFGQLNSALHQSRIFIQHRRQLLALQKVHELW